MNKQNFKNKDNINETKILLVEKISKIINPLARSKEKEKAPNNKKYKRRYSKNNNRNTKDHKMLL